MTFIPTPKADLFPLVQLGATLDALNQQVLSRLHYAEQAADWAASAIADLYARISENRLDALRKIVIGHKYLQNARLSRNAKARAMPTA